MNKRQYLIAQFGSNVKRRFVRSLVLEPSDLHGTDWSVYDDKCWRSGKFGATSERDRRARKTGSYNLLRTYNQAGTLRALIIEIRQLATPYDAQAESPGVRLNLYAAQEKGVTLTDAKLIDVSEVDQSSAIHLEQFALRGGQRTCYRYIVNSIDRIVFLTACISLDEGWPWHEVIRVSNLQAEKIQRKLAASSHKSEL